ncbi:MAG: ABC transporter ATP-binding protein [Bacillota bacterium]
MPAMELKQLSHLYRNGRGVHGVNLEVGAGEIFGFLGPNGAGKTTLIRTLLGLIRPTSGGGRILGLDIVRQSRDLRRRVGYLPSDPSLYDWLTGYQNIDFALRVRGVRDRQHLRRLAERLDVNLHQRLKTLSRGNKQKVAILVALAHDPDLLILDEPTSGLDPLMQEAFQGLIREEQERGKTVFMSSHVLGEVEALADRVGIIRDGRMVAVDRVDHLKKRRVKYVTCEFRAKRPDLGQVVGVRNLSLDGRRAQFTFVGDLDPLLAALSGYGLADLTVADPPLEEVFRSFYEEGSGQA